MRLIAAHFQITFLTHLRAPGYWAPTLLFPTMLYLFFAARLDDPFAATLALASWSVYAVLGVAFYQFGVGIAQDRSSPWETYLRVLPAGPLPRFAAQTLVAIVFAGAAVLVLWSTALWLAPIDFGPIASLHFAAALAVGAVPFGFFGIALGYLTSPKAAVPIANLIYLPLAFAGGLWVPPRHLPAAVADVSPLLPTRHYAEVVWAAVRRVDAPLASWLWLLGFTIFFAGLAVWAYRRDEGRRYR